MTGPANMAEKNEKIDMNNFVTREHSITSLTDKHYSLDCEDDLRSGCRNANHQQQFFSELRSPGRSHNTSMYDFLVHDCTREQNNNPFFTTIIRQCKWPSLSRTIVGIQKFCQPSLYFESGPWERG